MPTFPRLRIAHINDVYELANLPRVQTFLSKLDPIPTAVILAGDFLSPSTLSALDGGKGMVATLRAIGLTHVCLGNHEADLKLEKLERRLAKLSTTTQIVNSNVGRGHGIANEKEFNAGKPYEFLTKKYAPYSVIQTPCQRVNIALLGLMSDEVAFLRDGTFRGAPITNVIETYKALSSQLLQLQQNEHKDTHGNDEQQRRVDFILPMTHQSIHRDKELASLMLSTHLKDTASKGVILGGHEHVSMDVTVYPESGDTGSSNQHDHDEQENYVRILKSGWNAEAVQLTDLTFDFENDIARCVDIHTDLVSMSAYEPSVSVSQIVESHMSLLYAMEHEIIVRAGSLLPPGVPLSSKNPRRQQTTVGAVLCQAMKEELEMAHVVLLNGASLKGNAVYPDNGNMTYAQLKKELPFPTKMVVVPMKRWELQEAIYYSRTMPIRGETGPDVDRKGFLQVDLDFDRIGFHTGAQDDVLNVALPRNLLKGFCSIQPLITVGNRLEAAGAFPTDSDYIPAMDLIIRHFCKEKWYDLVQDRYSFDDFDVQHKGYLTREDVKRILTKAMGGTEPAEFVLTDMMNAVDLDRNGQVDPGEFSFVLAQMEREHGLIRFD